MTERERKDLHDLDAEVRSLFVTARDEFDAVAEATLEGWGVETLSRSMAFAALLRRVRDAARDAERERCAARCDELRDNWIRTAVKERAAGRGGWADKLLGDANGADLCATQIRAIRTPAQPERGPAPESRDA